MHQHIGGGGAKGARAPRGYGAKIVKSACFGLIFYQISLFSTPLVWNPAHASDMGSQEEV